MVACPLCDKPVKEQLINEHIDSGCQSHILNPTETPTVQKTHNFFSTPTARRGGSSNVKNLVHASVAPAPPSAIQADHPKSPTAGTKRSFRETVEEAADGELRSPTLPKRTKVNALQKVAPLAERM